MGLLGTPKSGHYKEKLQLINLKKAYLSAYTCV